MVSITFITRSVCKSFVVKFIVTLVFSFLNRPQKVIKKVIYYVVNVTPIIFIVTSIYKFSKISSIFIIEFEFDKN